MQGVLTWALVLALGHAAPANPAAMLPPSSGSATAFGRALVQRVKPAVVADDLWPLGGPPPGGLDRELHGYLRPGGVSEKREVQTRIPSVLHRIMFFEKDDITEREYKRSVDKRVWLVFGDSAMLDAYTAWETRNRVAGFCFRSYNLKDAEAYIDEHFEKPVLEAFQGIQPFAYKADLFRYLVLYNEGGWYADLKLEPVGVSLNELLERVALQTRMSPDEVSFVGARQNFGWNIPGAEGIINSFLGAKPRHPVLGDTIVRIVRDAHECRKGLTPWCLSGPYALYVGLGKRKGDQKHADSFVGGDHGVALLRFGFDEWHLPESGQVVIKKAKRVECGAGWEDLHGNNYIAMWQRDLVFDKLLYRKHWKRGGQQWQQALKARWDAVAEGGGGSGNG